MDEVYLPEFESVYLEDSYFLGLVANRSDLRFRFLFALALNHTDYAPPNPGEQHCYRRGCILAEQAFVVAWHPGRPTIIRDLDGTFDFGSIELYRSGPKRIRFLTEWFDATIDAQEFRLEFSDSTI